AGGGRLELLDGRFQAGIARHEERDERRALLLPATLEDLVDGAHRRPPRAGPAESAGTVATGSGSSACSLPKATTDSTSLSPRPERFTRRTRLLDRRGAWWTASAM